MLTVALPNVKIEGLQVTIVLPTYNERANIASMVERLNAALSDIEWEAIFVDDDSTDGTVDVIREISIHDRRIRCIRRVGRRGLAGACIEGALAAQAPFIIVMDADQQHDECILPKMLYKLQTGEADLVIGSRYLRGGSTAGLSSIRLKISRFANLAGRSLLGITVSDPMSGYFGIRRDVIDKLASEISTDGFKVLLDILATRRLKLRIAEIPYSFRTRLAGMSKLSTRVSLDFAALVLSRLTNNLLPQRFLLFSVVGCTGIGVHIAALSIFHELGVTFTTAQIISALIAVASNFVLNNMLTYRDQALHGWQAVRGLVIFYVICAFGIFGNIGVASWVMTTDKAWTIAGLAGAIMSAVWNYVVSAALVWGRR